MRDVVTGPVQRAVNNILAAFGKKAVYVRDKNGKVVSFDGINLVAVDKTVFKAAL